MSITIICGVAACYKEGATTHICASRILTSESKLCSTTGSKGIGNMCCLCLSCISICHCEFPVRCGHITYLSRNHTTYTKNISTTTILTSLHGQTRTTEWIRNTRMHGVCCMHNGQSDRFTHCTATFIRTLVIAGHLTASIICVCI